MISLIFLQGEKTKSYRTNVREMCSSSTLLKIKGTKELAYFVLFFVMLTSSSIAAPREYKIIDNGHQQQVVFETCEQLDSEHLRNQMGKYYDPKRMALDKKSIDHNSFDERSIGNMFDNAIDDDDNSDYQGDMPYYDSDLDEDDLDELSKFEKLHGNDERSKPDHNSIHFMRKKRQTDDNDLEKLKPSTRHSDQKPQRRIFSDVKKFIRKSKKGKKFKKLPWTCRMKPKWIRLDDGYFPPYVYSGSCQSSKKCFYNLYDCLPKKYGVTILKRDPSRCHPSTNSTMPKEVWIFDKIDVTVGCECGIGKSRKSRRRNNGRP